MGYRGKIDEQNQARDLRALGWTLSEICEELGVSKASASLWCRDVAIDEVELERRRRARNLAGNEGARQRGPNKLQRRKAMEIAEMQAAGPDDRRAADRSRAAAGWCGVVRGGGEQDLR